MALSDFQNYAFIKHQNSLLALMKLKESVYGLSRKNINKQQLYKTAKSKSKEEVNALHFRELKSSSRNRSKLRNYLFKNKNLVTEDTYLSPYRKDIIPSISTCHHFRSPQPFSTSSHIKSQRERPDPLNLKNHKKDSEKQRQLEKKQKKEFKLIHQIKKQKAKKAKEKVQVENQKSIIFFEQLHEVEFAGLKTMQHFTQQLQQVLQAHTKSAVGEISKIQQRKDDISIEKGLSNAKECLKRSKIVKQLSQNTKQSNNYHESQQKKLDLNRSVMKAKQILNKRKDSMSSNSQVQFRQSKIRQEFSLSLALYSRNDSRMCLSGLHRDMLQVQPFTTLEKLNFHLSILKSLSNFVLQSTKFDANSVQWQQLNFLIFKKYYIERVKIVNFLKRYPMKSPFNIYNAEINAKQIIQFMKKQQGKSFKEQMLKETKEIKEKLVSIYNHFEKQKLGQRINLFQCDNFSNWLIEELWAELILTQYDAVHQKEEVNIRLCRILQIIFLISELNGKYEFPFEEAEIAISNKQYQKYIKEGKAAFQQYILYQNP